MGYSIREQLTAEEDSIPYAYQDHLGYWTIGVGRLIDRRKGGGLRGEEIAYLLNNDIRDCEKEIRASLPWYDSLNDPRKAVLIGMCFQMGVMGLLKFRTTLSYMSTHQHDAAASQMLNSLWAKQTPDRAKRMSEQWRTGVWQKKP